MAAGPSYWDYLQLDKLLELQGGIDGDGHDVASVDELHFIVVHQIYELWFKLINKSLRLARDRMAEPKVAEETIPYVVHHLRRVSTVLQLAVQHWKVVETLTPQDFLAFRDKLMPASGFQSFQMREMEIVMGLEEADRIAYGNMRPIEHIQSLGHGSPAGDYARAHIEAARQEGTFLGALQDWLYRTPIHGSSPGQRGDDEVVTAFVDGYLVALEAHQAEGFARLLDTLGERSRADLEVRFEATRAAGRAFLGATDVADEALRPRVRRCRAAALFIESYRELPLLAWPRLLLDVVVEMEEELLLFRHRHARMVERVIGRRVGTGGSGGVDYLDKTSSYRVFRDLWAIRTVLLPKARLPSLADAELYGFAVDPTDEHPRKER
jgi:tryptophan 2,3-dioxygenase